MNLCTAFASDKLCATRGFHAMQGNRRTADTVITAAFHNRKNAFTFGANNYMAFTGNWATVQVCAGKTSKNYSTVICSIA